jgi:hypothetical protein
MRADKKALRIRLKKIFKKLDYTLKDESKLALQFFLRYSASKGARNTLRLEIIDNQFESNVYKAQYLKEIDRYAACQTIETMFANKLVAIIERFRKHKSLAGRDVYDIHYFFTQGYNYLDKVIEERTGIKVLAYFKKLENFIDKKINQRVIDQDLNVLLEPKKFKAVRLSLKKECLMLVRDEIKRLG